MKSGLEDVIAADTVLSDVDGAAGRLIIRGSTLEDLAGSRYEDAVLLLLGGLCDGLPDARKMVAALGEARLQVAQQLLALDPGLLRLQSLEAMRALIARLDDGEDVGTALRLIAAPAVFMPAIVRRRAGLEPITPDASLPHAEDILRMMHGRAPRPEQVAALDTYLVAVCDHGLNASTFTARVVASTRAGLTSSVLAALGALKGPLHGGAPGPVLDMLDAIGEPANAHAWLDAALKRGERLMGFGHRIYRVRDPRADALKRALLSLTGAGQVDAARTGLAEAVEREALALLQQRKPDRTLATNVEFYTALLLEALGFPREAFTGVFAMGRTAGWLAHAREQILDGRLIRPQSRYVGPAPRDAA